MTAYGKENPDWRAVNWSAAGAAHGNLTPPRISPSCPHCLRLWLDRLFLPGRRDHCETGCHACFWLDEYRSAPSLPFIDARAGRFCISGNVMCCHPSSGDHLPLLFVTGYNRFASAFFKLHTGTLISCGIIVIHPISD